MEVVDAPPVFEPISQGGFFSDLISLSEDMNRKRKFFLSGPHGYNPPPVVTHKKRPLSAINPDEPSTPTKKQKNETAQPHVGRKNKCGKCGGYGHNSRRCAVSELATLTDTIILNASPGNGLDENNMTHAEFLSLLS